MSLARRCSRTITILVALGLLVSCKKIFDRNDLAKSIKAYAEGAGLPLKEVDCPRDIAMKKGASFPCNGTTAEGERIDFNVDQTDDNGHVFVQASNGAILDMAKMGDLIEKQVHEKADVKCPPKAMFMTPGKKFTCDVSIEGNAHHFEFEVTGTKGELKWREAH